MINDRLHDKIQQLANGELDARDEAQLRREIDGNPEALGLLSQYSALRKDMGLLHDIPADQLSKERLRSRLLGEALKPDRPAPFWSWFWMPTAAAAFAFVLYLNQHKGPEMPQVVGTPSVASVSGNLGGSETKGILLSPSPNSTSKIAIAAVGKQPEGKRPLVTRPRPVDTVASLETKSVHRHAIRTPETSARPEADTVAAVTPAESPNLLDSAARTAVGAMAAISPKATALSAPGDADKPGDSIVVISNNVDGDTGAQHATEEAASNVLSGG